MAIVFVGCTPAQFEWLGSIPASIVGNSTYRRSHVPSAIEATAASFRIPEKNTPAAGAFQFVIGSSATSNYGANAQGMFRVGNFCIDRAGQGTSPPVVVHALDSSGAKAEVLTTILEDASRLAGIHLFSMSYSATSLKLYMDEELLCDVTTQDTGNKVIQLGGSRFASLHIYSEVVVDDDPSKTKQKYVSFFRANAADKGATITGDVSSLLANDVLKGVGGDAAGQYMELNPTAVNVANIPGSYSKKTTTLHYSTDAPNLAVEFSSRKETTSDPLVVLHTQPADPAPVVREQIVIPNYDTDSGLPNRVRMTLR